MSQSIIVGAIEIGTAKILAAIGKIEIGRGLNIIGMGESVSRGMKKGRLLTLKGLAARLTQPWLPRKKAPRLHS